MQMHLNCLTRSNSLVFAKTFMFKASRGLSCAVLLEGTMLVSMTSSPRQIHSGSANWLVGTVWRPEQLYAHVLASGLHLL